MATYTQSQIENVWFALNLNRLKPNNDMQSGAGLHNPNGSINMYKWLQDALDLLGNGSCGTSIGAVTLNGDAPLFTSTTCGATMNFTAGSGITLTGDGPTKSITIAASGGGSGDNIYNIDGALAGDRVVDLNSKTLTFSTGISPYNTTIWGSNFFTQSMGKTSGYVDKDVNTHIQSGLFGVAASSSIDSTYHNATDTITAAVTTSSFGSGNESVSARMSIDNNIDTYGIDFSLYNINGSYPFAQLNLPTYFEDGQGSTIVEYMVPTRIERLNHVVEYAYPLEKFTYTFASDVQGSTTLNTYSKQGMITNSDGDKRNIVRFVVGGSFSPGGAGDLQFTIFDKTGSVFAQVPSSGVIDVTGFTGGVAYEEAIPFPFGAMPASDYLYARVVTSTGDALNIKGLELIIETI